MSAAAMAQHHYSFPVVTGIDPADPIASRKSRIAVYLRMLAELDANSEHFSEQISEIDLTDPEDARVLMPEQGDDILAHFGEDRFAERYRRYKEHIAEWRKQYPRLASVDLRYEQQVVLQMKNASTVEEGSGDKATAEGKSAGAAQNAKAGAAAIGTAAAGAALAAHVATNATGAKPEAAKAPALETADGKPAAKTDGKTTLGTTSMTKPKPLTAKQKAAKQEAAREKLLEAKAAQMRAAREKAAAAKQNKKPVAAQPSAADMNGHKTATTTHPVQEGQ
jgi:cell division protein FtsQ